MSEEINKYIYLCLVDTLLHQISAHGNHKHALSKSVMLNVVWYVSNHPKFKYPRRTCEGHIELYVTYWYNQ